jgi:hypothetical protein
MNFLLFYFTGAVIDKVFEIWVLRKQIEPKREKVADAGENYIMRSIITCTLYHMLFGL